MSKQLNTLLLGESGHDYLGDPCVFKLSSDMQDTTTVGFLSDGQNFHHLISFQIPQLKRQAVSINYIIPCGHEIYS